MPSIDLGPLNASIGHLLRRANLVVLEHGNVAFGRLGLRPPQYGILVYLAYTPDQMQSHVGIALGFKRPNFVKMVDELEALGWAKRSPVPGDARAHRLSLTKDGRDLLRRAKKVDAKIDAHFARMLGASGHAQLLRHLRKLAGVA